MLEENINNPEILQLQDIDLGQEAGPVVVGA